MSNAHRSFRQIISMLVLLSGVFALPSIGIASESTPRQTGDRPNLIFIFCDNLGYGDVACFGNTLHRTPNIDRMAKEGMKFTSFYATSGVCTPSRSSLMTACYPRRVNMHISDLGGSVLRPVSPKGLNPSEITIAEVLKTAGYATACIGKWHLGDQLVYLPTRQGFDYYYGIPYSDDMTARDVNGRIWPPLPLMRNEKVIEAPAECDTLTNRCTQEVIRFITEHKDEPFFVYMPQPMPGSTLAPFASEAFRGQSANGPWGDSIEEIDWSTGEILKALKDLKLDENTLVIWTSDNGAPLRNPPQGSNKPLGGSGYTASEGGQRVPCVMRWPGKIPANTVCDELTTTMDIMPTFAHLGKAPMPNDRIIDGHDIWTLMSGKPNAISPYKAFYYYHIDQLQAVRSGKWKLWLPLELKRDREDRKNTPAILIDLSVDLLEENNLADDHPDVVRRLMGYADEARADLGDMDREGSGQRPAGFISHTTPRVVN